MSDLSLWDIPELFDYQFFRFALVGGIIAAMVCSWVGLFLILRNESMIADGVAHTAFGGIALGLYLGINPTITALFISILAVLCISYMRKKGLAQSDSAIAVILAVGFAGGVILINLSGGFKNELWSYLFGDILTVSIRDIQITSVLGISTILFLGVFYKELLSMTFDEEAAKLMGIPVKSISLIFNLLVAFTIVLSIKIIGIILVIALIVLPGLSALQLNLSFKKTTLASILFGIASVVVGIMLSAIYDFATGGVIVMTAVGLFIFTIGYKKLE